MKRHVASGEKSAALKTMRIIAALVLSSVTAAVLLSDPRDSGGRAQGLVTAADIVEKFIQASGGAELARVKTEKRRGTLVRGASGQVPFETVSAASGAWIYSQVFAYGDRVSYGFDGVRAWVQDAGGTGAMPAAERLELSLLLDIQAPLKLERLFPKMAVKGRERVGEREAVVLEVFSEEGLCSELAFDRVTGLLLRAGDLFFEDYRDVGGVKRPFVVFFGKEDVQNSLRLKMQAAEIRRDVEVDASIFARPTCALSPGPPVLYQLRKEIPVSQESLEALAGVYQSDVDPRVQFTVTTQGPHLMIEKTGWGFRLEILPESPLEYFMRFLNREFRFVKDAAGRVTGLEMGPNPVLKATRIK